MEEKAKNGTQVPLRPDGEKHETEAPWWVPKKKRYVIDYILRQVKKRLLQTFERELYENIFIIQQN